MKVAIMQPYLFPYLGYFQLIKAVDNFVFYDDVNYIKQGWINKNRILTNGSVSEFTVSLSGASSFQKICETRINQYAYQHWKGKFFKTLEHSYKKTPYFKDAFEVVSLVFSENHEFISDLAFDSVMRTCRYLGIQTQITDTSRNYQNDNLNAQDRVIDICLKENADEYINPIGGRELYDHASFNQQGLKLHFLKASLSPYPQGSAEFILGLSIIDLMMNLAPIEILQMTTHHELAQ